jgi:hypothetical protein
MTINSLAQSTYNILNEENSSDNRNYPVSFVRWLIVDAYILTNYTWYTNPINWKKLAYPQKVKSKTVKKYMNRCQYVSHAWSTMTVTTTEWFDSGWSVYMNWMSISYTGKTTTTFTWCSDIVWSTADLAWSDVRQWHVVWWRLLRIRYEWVDCETYENVIFLQNNLPRYYAEWGYIYTRNEWYHNISYLPTPTAPATNDTELPIPWYHQMYLAYIVAGEIMYNRWQSDEWSVILSQWMMKLWLYYDEIQQQYQTQYPNKMTQVRWSWLNI